jgi:hypothetical protein
MFYMSLFLHSFSWSSEFIHPVFEASFDVVPVLFFVILIRIGAAIAKSEIFRRLWYRNLFALWDRPHCRWQIWIFHFMFGFGGDPCCLLNESNNRMRGLLVPSEPRNGERHSAPTVYPSCQKPCACYTAWLRGPTCILVNHFISPKIACNVGRS